MWTKDKNSLKSAFNINEELEGEGENSMQSCAGKEVEGSEWKKGEDECVKVWLRLSQIYYPGKDYDWNW